MNINSRMKILSRWLKFSRIVRAVIKASTRKIILKLVRSQWIYHMPNLIAIMLLKHRTHSLPSSPPLIIFWTEPHKPLSLLFQDPWITQLPTPPNHKPTKASKKSPLTKTCTKNQWRTKIFATSSRMAKMFKISCNSQIWPMEIYTRKVILAIT